MYVYIIFEAQDMVFRLIINKDFIEVSNFLLVP